MSYECCFVRFPVNIESRQNTSFARYISFKRDIFVNCTNTIIINQSIKNFSIGIFCIGGKFLFLITIAFFFSSNLGIFGFTSTHYWILSRVCFIGSISLGYVTKLVIKHACLRKRGWCWRWRTIHIGPVSKTSGKNETFIRNKWDFLREKRLLSDGLSWRYLKVEPSGKLRRRSDGEKIDYTKLSPRLKRDKTRSFILSWRESAVQYPFHLLKNSRRAVCTKALKTQIPRALGKIFG